MTVTTTTVTSPAGPTAYLQAVKDRQAQACGLKRPTLAALRDCAAALGLDCAIERQSSKGFKVCQHGAAIKASTLADVAAALLKIHGEAWNVDAAINGAIALLCERYPVSSRATYLPAAKALKARGAVINASSILREMEKVPAPLLPGEAPRSAPAPTAAPAPTLPELPESSRFASGRFDGLQPWGSMPGYVVQSQQQQQPQQAPAPVVAPGPRARKVAPSHLPVEGGRLLQRFELKLDSILTAGLANSKIAKGKALAHSAIYHGLPGRQLAVAIYGPEGGSVPARGRLAEVRRLALANGLGSDAQRLDACPWASDGCRDGCLVFSGRNAMGSAPAACKARRSLARLWCPQVFMIVLLWAIAKEYSYAQARGLALSLRLKGTDDLPHHLQTFSLSPSEAVTLQRRYGLPALPGQHVTLPEVLSLAMGDGSIRWYEYSKAPVGGRQGLEQMRALGIDVTASLAADRPQGARAACGAVRAGFRLAVPVALPKGAPIPAELKLAPTLGLPAPADSPEFGRVPADDRPVRLLCIDGDLTDLRWLDPQGPQPLGFDGVAVILRTKASKGAGPDAEPFSLQPLTGQWQALKGGGFAKLEMAS